MKKIIFLILLLCAHSIIYAQKKVNLSGNVGIFAPIGNFSEVSRLGIGGTANLRYSLVEEFEIAGVIGYLLSGSKVGQYTNKVLPGLIGCRYYPDGKKDKVLKPYVLALGGFQYTKIDFGYFSVNTKTYYGISLGGGFLYTLSEKLDIEVGLSVFLMDDASHLTLMIGLSDPF